MGPCYPALRGPASRQRTKQSLDALEHYRGSILPDGVRLFRDVFARGQLDLNAQLGEFVTAQQTLAASVTSYLGIPGSLWSSVVSVADVLPTDLFRCPSPRPCRRCTTWPVG
jgi:hypothetical protein